MVVSCQAAVAQARRAFIRPSLIPFPLSSTSDKSGHRLFLNDDYSEEEIEGEGCEDQYEDREITGFGIHNACKEGRNEKTTSHAAEDEAHPRRSPS